MMYYNFGQKPTFSGRKLNLVFGYVGSNNYGRKFINRNSRLKNFRVFSQSSSQSQLPTRRQRASSKNKHDDMEELENDKNFNDIDEDHQQNNTKQQKQSNSKNKTNQTNYTSRKRPLRQPPLQQQIPEELITSNQSQKPQISKKPVRRKNSEDTEENENIDQPEFQVKQQSQISSIESHDFYEDDLSENWGQIISEEYDISKYALSQSQNARKPVQYSGKGLPEWLATSLPNIIWQIMVQQRYKSLKIVPHGTQTKICYPTGEEIPPEGGFVLPTKGPVIIGRGDSKGCDVLLNSPYTSKKHLRVEFINRSGEQKFVVVADGTNDTYLNGTVIKNRQEVVVKEGDVLSLGSKDEGDGCSVELKGTDVGDDISAIGLAMYCWCVDVEAKEYRQNAMEELNSLHRWEGKEQAVKFLKQYLMDLPTQWQLWWLWAIWEAKKRNISISRQLFRAAYEALEVFIFRQNSSFTNLSYKYRRLFSKEITYILRDWGLMEWQQGNHSSARRLWQRGANFGGKFQGTLTRHLYHVWTRCEIESGNIFRARQIIQDAVKTFPRHPDILNMAGFVEIVGNRFDRAVKILRLAAQISPQHKKVLNNLAKAEWETGNKDEARKIFKKILKKHPNSSKTLHRWAVQEEKDGNFSAAIEMQERALQIDPNSATTIRNREHLACMYMSTGQHGLAREILNYGLNLHWGHAMLHVPMAQLELDGSNFQSCYKHLNVVLRKQPDYIDALKVLIQYYRKQGDQDRASKVEKRARKLCTTELQTKQRLRT